MIEATAPMIDITRKPMIRCFQLREGHSESFEAAPMASPMVLEVSSPVKLRMRDRVEFSRLKRLMRALFESTGRNYWKFAENKPKWENSADLLQDGREMINHFSKLAPFEGRRQTKNHPRIIPEANQTIKKHSLFGVPPKSESRIDRIPFLLLFPRSTFAIKCAARSYIKKECFDGC